jgi:hypothetical protein
MSNVAKQEIYCMTDIEADGKCPGISNLLSFATAAYDIDKNLIGTFEANLELMPGMKSHPDTDAFWNESAANRAAYAKTRENTRDPKIAMSQYVTWLESLPGTPIFVGYPAAFDFKWIDFYTVYFLGQNPYNFSRVIDVKSFAWAQLAVGTFQSCSKRRMPKEWFDEGLPHTHIAIDDAIEQGAMFINMLRENRGLPAIKGIPNM